MLVIVMVEGCLYTFTCLKCEAWLEVLSCGLIRIHVQLPVSIVDLAIGLRSGLLIH